MKEEFLHFIWKNRLFHDTDLKTIREEPVQVIDTGIYNTDSGPDFLSARISLNDTQWAGNIEIHIKSSLWNVHGHNSDHAYDNVILHVVAEYDSVIETSDGRIPETLILSWDESVYGNWLNFLHNPSYFPCEEYLGNIDKYRLIHAVHNASIERLSKKSQNVSGSLRETAGDWEETLYRLIARYFGMNVNNEAFTRLAAITPLKIVRKLISEPIRAEALFMGQAGFLNGGFFRDVENDEYYRILANEYKFLKAKYEFTPMHQAEWRFHRMRPANFPTIRISQLARLITTTDPLFSKIRSANTASRLEELFVTRSSEYWETHFLFGKPVRRSQRRVGKGFIQVLIINAVMPLLFLYGREHGQQMYCDICMDIEDNLPPEINRITRLWKKIGIEPSSAFESQGLIHIFSELCKKKKCLNCHIGSKLISLGSDIQPWQIMNLGEKQT